MPLYTFECQDCHEEFTLKLTFQEREAKESKCPKCGGQNLKPVFSAFYAKTSKKS